MRFVANPGETGGPDAPDAAGRADGDSQVDALFARHLARTMARNALLPFHGVMPLGVLGLAGAIVGSAGPWEQSPQPLVFAVALGVAVVALIATIAGLFGRPRVLGPHVRLDARGSASATVISGGPAGWFTSLVSRALADCFAGPAVVLDSGGVRGTRLRSAEGGVVRWDDIGDVLLPAPRVARVAGPLVGIVTVRHDAPTAPAEWIPIRTVGLGLDAWSLARVVTYYRTHPGARTELGTRASLERIAAIAKDPVPPGPDDVVPHTIAARLRTGGAPEDGRR